MEDFKYGANQPHQSQAIDSVIDLLEGQPKIEATLTFSMSTGFGTIANRLDLHPDDLLANLRDVQARNSLVSDDQLHVLSTTEGSDEGFFNFSVEMETGTGKTYVYIRTALELFLHFGLRKFIVVVPSVAIREGVLKEFEHTRQHFAEMFGNLPYRAYSYDSRNISMLRQFAVADNIEFMVMTLAAFNKEAVNVIYQPTDALTEVDAPIDLIRAARPILILDEPQNMESEQSIHALSALDPLFALRYSATHRNHYNLLYRLTPFDAYRQGLVKRIEVASVVKEDDLITEFIRVEDLVSRGRQVSAKLTVHKLMRGGNVKEGALTVRPGDSLATKTNRPEYEGFEVEEISPGGGFVRFANSVELRKGEAIGADKDVLFGEQIRYTIEQHFRKQARLKDHGIKVLSLFFIDKVENYAPVDGVIRQLFRQHFEELQALPQYAAWKGLDADEVSASYFAQKKRSGVVESIDSSSGETAADTAAFQLIMKDKKRLLSFEEKVGFVFSHTALREGWDNPNVFQICTLNQAISEMRKRQEVGRGVRLARNQTGDRVDDPEVNVLTVVANESYDDFVRKLQAEITEEYGEEETPPPPPNARKRGTAVLSKERMLSPEFKTLWERISQRTRYAVRIDSEELVRTVISKLQEISIPPPRVAVIKVELQVQDEAEVFEALQLSGAKAVRDLSNRYPAPNLVEVMANLMENTTPPMRLTRQTLLNIYLGLPDREAALKNPHEFAVVAVRTIKQVLADHIVEGIEYEKIDEWYEMTLFEPEISGWQEYLIPANNSLYDHVVYDSKTIEKPFVEALENRKDVKLYVKLPSWFKVDTPIGKYNPDWAIVLEAVDQHGDPTGEERCYLVRETKGANWRTALRPDEERKIRCGRRHFSDALGIHYAVVSDASEVGCPPTEFSLG